MPVFLANPAGLWTLLGIPVILLIHFLQRQSQTLPSSTLFLLDAIDRRSLQGRKIDRLRNSLPLWLQLLCVLLLTWLLVEPRWDTDASVQRIVLVLDSSASMEAFREEAVEQLQNELPRLTAQTGEASYTVLESHHQGEKLYRGASLPDLITSLAGWEPSNSAHSPEASLRVGRSLAGSGGTLIFVTDHIDDSLPYGATLLSVGEPLENVGFAGQTIDKDGEEKTWQVTVRNYASTAQTREWFLAAGQQRTAARSLTLEPGATRTLAGKFPNQTRRVNLVLESDKFTRDDTLFLILPEPKQLLVAHNVAPNATELVSDIIQSLENAPLFGTTTAPEGATPAEEPDLVFATYNPLQPRPFPEVSIVFLNQENVPREFFKGPIVAANHPLIDNLNWQGLIARKTPSIPASPADTPLLWQGDRSLLVLRQSGGQRQLLFNFDVVQSNAARLPSFIVLIDRFLAMIREEKIAPRSDNAELRQPIPVAFSLAENAPPLTLTAGQLQETFPLNRSALVRAPRDPGFFEIRQGNQLLFEGSGNFADTREADFSAAASRSDLSTLPREIIERHTVTDPWWQAWAIGLLLLAVLCWAALNRGEREPSGGLAEEVS